MKKVREIPSFVHDPSCVLYIPLWKRDGNTFISDDAFGHLCTVTGATWGTQGRLMDGDDYITIPFNSALNIATELTVIYWCKPTTIGNRCDIQNGDLSGSWICRLGQSTEGFAIYDGTWERLSVTIPSVVAWYQIAVTYNASKLVTYYRNALVHTSATFTKSLPTIDAGLTIGHEQDAGFGSTFFIGTFGEVSIYNRALSAQEIQQSYQSTKWRYV